MRSLIPLFLLLIARTSGAVVTESLSYTYYDVLANPAQSLLSVLDASSPYKENGRVLHAYTTWVVRLNFSRVKSPNGRCRLSQPSTELTASIAMPRLVGGSPAQQIDFDRYFSALRTHELGHYEIGEKAALDIERKIISLSDFSSCRALEIAKDKLFARTMSKYLAAEVEYDRKTEHGKTQGAWLVQ